MGLNNQSIKQIFNQKQIEIDNRVIHIDDLMLPLSEGHFIAIIDCPSQSAFQQLKE